MNKEIVYVCPICFSIKDKCNCNVGYIELDKNIQPIIKTLNNKGYKTLFSCEGHSNVAGEYIDVYIMFASHYDFRIAPPMGAKFNKNNSIHYMYRSPNIADKENHKINVLHELTNWANAL